jgi:hypothetical protein
MNIKYTQQEEELMNIALENCYMIFDPRKQMPHTKLVELIDSEIKPDYYLTFFMVNTCELLKD